ANSVHRQRRMLRCAASLSPPGHRRIILFLPCPRSSYIFSCARVNVHRLMWPVMRPSCNAGNRFRRAEHCLSEVRILETTFTVGRFPSPRLDSFFLLPVFPKAGKFFVEIGRCSNSAEEVIQVDEFIRRMSVLITQSETEDHSVDSKNFFKFCNNRDRPAFALIQHFFP